MGPHEGGTSYLCDEVRVDVRAIDGDGPLVADAKDVAKANGGQVRGRPRKTLDLGGEGGKLSGATKMCSLRTEKLSPNWHSRKNCWCLVKVPTVDKKLSRNRQRGEEFLYGMVPFRFSFSPMRGI